jgi:hypothetical protein
VVLHLLLVPTDADAECDATAGKQIEGGDRLGEDDRVVLGDQRGCRCRGAGAR